MMNCFVVWLTEERRLAILTARTIVRDPHHRESPKRHEQDLNLRRTWLSCRSIKLCSSYNHFTMAPLKRIKTFPNNVFTIKVKHN